jgi:hypothetical protein
MNATKKLFNKDNFKTHHRHSSMEIKFDKTKSPITNLKNIHAMKEMLLANNSNMVKNGKTTTINNNHNNQNNSNIILNQNGIPCFNNINIYTTNNNNNIKGNEINLRHYVFNKITKPKSLSKIQRPGHARSSSINN